MCSNHRFPFDREQRFRYMRNLSAILELIYIKSVEAENELVHFDLKRKKVLLLLDSNIMPIRTLPYA